MKRNLSYFVYPFKGSLWHWNVQQIRSALGVFNGRKIVSVAEDANTETLEEVEKVFDDPSISYVRVVNSEWLGEVAGFIPSIERLQSLDSEELTFYAHAKGIKFWGSKQDGVKAWAKAMYRLNLTDTDVIEWLMRKYAAVGAFRMANPGLGSPWIFAGNFWWMKHSALFARDWRNIGLHKHGVERYLGDHLKLEESFDLTLGRQFQNLYDVEVPDKEIDSILVELRSAKDADRIPGAL